MQLPVDSTSTILVPLGSPVRSSLMMQFARQHNYEYIKLAADPTLDDIVQTVIRESKSKKVIVDGVQGTVQILIDMEVKLNPDRLAVVQFGNANTDQEKAIATYFHRLGKYHFVECVQSPNETYRNLRRAVAHKIIFIYGPPLALKSEIAKAISHALGYHYINFSHLRQHILKQTDGIVLANKFIKLCMHAGRDLVVDGFFEHPEELTVLEEYLIPLKVIHIKPTKDEVESKIKSLKKAEQRAYKAKEFEEYAALEKDLVSFLSKKPYYVKVVPGEEPAKKVLKLLYPKIVYIQGDSKFPEQFAQQWGAIHLSPGSFAKSQIERETPFGGALISHGSGSENANLYQDVIKMFRQIIYSLNSKIVLSGLPNSVQHFQFFEHHIAPISNYVAVTKQYNEFSNHLTPEMYYLAQQKLIIEQNSSSPEHLIDKLNKRKHYLIVNGPQGSGKTSLAKQIAKQYHYKLIECQTYLPTLKEKLLTAEDGEQLPIAKVTKHFIEMANKEQEPLLFDGLPYEGKDLNKFFKDLGDVAYPVIINLKADQKNLLKRNRKKAESDVNAEVTEEDTQRMDSFLEKNNTWLKAVEQSLQSEVKLFQLDFNIPLISASKLLPSILRPRVFLITQIPPHNLIYLNIALRYRMDYIDLHGVQNFQEKIPNIKNCRQRDIILVNYRPRGLVSDDINWIQSNVGVVRYMATWANESKTIAHGKIPLERPKVEEKPKVLNEQGQEVKEEQPEPQDPDAPPKPKFDIYDHEWSVTGEAHNLTQWFLALKHPNNEIVSQANDIFQEFDLVLKDLNNDRELCIYQLVK